MLDMPLNERYQLSIHVRPISHAFFIPSDDCDMLEHVARLCCSQWGGVRNLLIPIDTDGAIEPLYRLTLLQAAPGRFVSFLPDDGHGADTVVRDQLADAFPQRVIALQRGKTFEGMDPSTHALDAFASRAILTGSHDLADGLGPSPARPEVSD